MATVSSHVLDAIHGVSAVGIAVVLTRISADGTRSEVFSTRTDQEGRISELVDTAGQSDTYELAFRTADYFRAKNDQSDEDRVMEAVVVQIRMTDPDKRYHLPIMASPHSYSLWWSR